MDSLPVDKVLAVFESAWSAATATGQPLASIGKYGLNQSQPAKKDVLPRAVAYVEDSLRVSTTCASSHWSITIELRLFDTGTVEIRTAKAAVLNWLKAGESGLLDIDKLNWNWPAGVTPQLLQIESDGTSKPDRAVARGTIRMRFDVCVAH